jgi:hypothetical protein
LQLTGTSIASHALQETYEVYSFFQVIMQQSEFADYQRRL